MYGLGPGLYIIHLEGREMAASYNDVNELLSQSGAGFMRFRGSVNDPVTNLTVGGNAATVNTNPEGVRGQRRLRRPCRCERWVLHSADHR